MLYVLHCTEVLQQTGALGQNAKYSLRANVFRFALKLGHCPMRSACLKRAKNGSQARYSITSSASASKVGGTAMPTTFAVLRLIAKINLLACSIGRSPGLVPLSIFAT